MRAVSPLGLFPILCSLRKHKNTLPLPVTGKFKDAKEEWLCLGCNSVRDGQKNFGKIHALCIEAEMFCGNILVSGLFTKGKIWEPM